MSSHRYILATILVLSLTWMIGCSGKTLPAVAGASTAVSSIRDEQSATSPVCLRAACIYVTCWTLRAPGRVNLYLAKADGNRSPVAQITGKPSQLYEPTGVAEDSTGNVYVAGSGGINVYGAGRYAQPPVRTISGPRTGLSAPEQIALDKNRNLYVANSGNSSITVYAPGSKGNVIPIRTIKGDQTGLATPWGITVGFGRVYVTNYISSDSSSITIYRADSNGNAKPIRTISGEKTGLGGPKGIAVDAKARIYVANANELSVTVYKALAKGNDPPIAQISGAKTRLFEPNDIAVDASGSIYVTNGKPSRSNVTIYDPGTNGNIPPIATISGAQARLKGCEARSIDVR